MANYFYSVISDTQNSGVDPEQLHEEIEAASLTIDGVNVDGDVLKIVTPEDLDAAQQTTLTNTVNAHSDLPAYKQQKKNKIDKRTNILIIETPVDHNSKGFSMSNNAQRNWIGMLALRNAGMLTYPIQVSTSSEAPYEIADDAEFLMFIGAVFTYQTDPSKPLHSGRVLKAQVDAAVDRAGVDAVVDTR